MPYLLQLLRSDMPVALRTRQRHLECDFGAVDPPAIGRRHLSRAHAANHYECDPVAVHLAVADLLVSAALAADGSSQAGSVLLEREGVGRRVPGVSPRAPRFSALARA